MDGAPDVTEFETLCQTGLDEAKLFYDELVTAINPDRSARAGIHPRRYFATDLNALNDAIKEAELVNRR